MATAPKFKVNPHMVDPDVQVPAAVRRAAEAATAAQLAAHPVDPASAPPRDPNLPPDTITIAEPPAPQLPEGVTPTVVAPMTTPPVTPAPQLDDATWEQKYNAMHGQFKRADSDRRSLTQRVETLENLLTMAKPQDAPPPAPAATPTKLITSQEEADFGPEMIDVMRRAAREVASPELETLRQTVKGLEQKLQGTSQAVTMDARGRMLAAMDTAMPDWQVVNHAPEFHAWLALPDPYSGATRKKLLSDAYEANQTSRVLAFFRGFVSELAATQPPEPVTPTPSAPQPPAKPTLQALAAPGRARTSASVTPTAEKQIIYTSDINALYDAKRKGLYAGREAEFASHERELELAMREGRVVTNT
jgi:hypothetical protein